MGAFTAIPQVANPQLDWSALSFINEIRQAQSERSQAIGGGTIADVAAGADVQAASFWETIQLWLEANCLSFFNDGGDAAWDVDGDYSATRFGVMKNFATVGEWRAAAGIHSSGFRRTAGWDPTNDDWTNNADPMYVYGTMQEDDIIGPWIMDDIQKGLIAMRRLWSAQPSITTEYRSAGGERWWDEPCSDGLARQHTAWTSSSWSNLAGVIVYMVYRIYYGPVSSKYYFAGDRIKSVPTLTGINTVAGLSYNWKFYCYPSSYLSRPFENLDESTLGYSFADRTFNKYDTGSGSGATITVNSIGADDTNPLDLTGTGFDALDCSDTPTAGDSIECNGDYIIEWGFTHDEQG